MQRRFYVLTLGIALAFHDGFQDSGKQETAYFIPPPGGEKVSEDFDARRGLQRIRCRVEGERAELIGYSYYHTLESWPTEWFL